MDDLLTFVAPIAIYLAIFAVLGVAFYAVDRRFKAWVARPRKPRR